MHIYNSKIRGVLNNGICRHSFIKPVEVLLCAFLFGSALYESLLAASQLLGISHSLNARYPFTGTFYNPGPFACFLAFTFPIVVRSFYCISKRSGTYGKKGVRNYLSLASVGLLFALDILLLPASMSRTAWIAASTGTAVSTFDLWYPVFRKHRILIILSSLGIAVVFLLLAYNLKEHSASGRFLMWKIAFTCVDADPFHGSGWQQVAGEYGMAQEKYFASGEGSEMEMLVAGTPGYVFNEYLQVAIAYGWVWSVIMIILLSGSFVTAFMHGKYGVAGAVAASASVMVSSYPFQFHISIMTIGAIVISGYLFATRKRVIAFGIIPAITGTIFLITDSGIFDSDACFREGMAFHRMGEWEKSNDVMKELLRYSSDPMPLNIMGKNYMAQGKRDSAEYELKRSVNRCPNRLYPHYLLMKLYMKGNVSDSLLALKEAEYIVNKKEKIASPAVDDMRGEAVTFIIEYEK